MTHSKLIEAMCRREFYPHRVENVELIQTHISYIFIAGDFVYKVKKPVDFGFLDFTDLKKRKYYCHEEVRLNRRLAPHVYVAVAEIFEDSDGHIALDRGDVVIEYAVKMKKIPQDRMLKKLFSEERVNLAVMDAIAKKLAVFHRQAETGGMIDEIGGIATIRKNHDENFAQTKDSVNITIPGSQYYFIKSYIYDFMARHEPLLLERVADHRIRDCHGDLHLEHICIMEEESIHRDIDPDSIVIFDCIEFNERFRYEDVAAEVAFLAMDLDYNGYPDHADAFVRAYVKHSEDHDIYILLNFYKCYYAYVRGKVVGFRIHDLNIPEAERTDARRIASRYFELAYIYAARLEKPTLILISGLMGTGKTIRARHMSSLLGAEVIQTDALRKEILNMAPTDRHLEAFGEGIYADAITRRTYEEALTRAEEELRKRKPVIIDASYKKREDRMKAFDTAHKLKADFFIIECILNEEIIRERLDARMKDTQEASDGRWEIFQEQKKTFEPITEIPDKSHIIIDASLTPEEGVGKAIAAMKRFPDYGNQV